MEDPRQLAYPVTTLSRLTGLDRTRVRRAQVRAAGRPPEGEAAGDRVIYTEYWQKNEVWLMLSSGMSVLRLEVVPRPPQGPGPTWHQAVGQRAVAFIQAAQPAGGFRQVVLWQEYAALSQPLLEAQWAGYLDPRTRDSTTPLRLQPYKAHELSQRTVRKVVEQAQQAGVAKKDVYGLLDLDADAWAAHPAFHALQAHDALLAQALREAVILRCLLKSEWEQAHGHLEWLRGRLYSRMPNALVKQWRGSVKHPWGAPRTSVGARVRAAQSAAWRATSVLLRDTILDPPAACGQHPKLMGRMWTLLRDRQWRDEATRVNRIRHALAVEDQFRSRE